MGPKQSRSSRAATTLGIEKLSRKCVRESRLRVGDLWYQGNEWHQSEMQKFTATTRLGCILQETPKPFWLCTSLLIRCLATTLKRRKEHCVILIGFSGS